MAKLSADGARLPTRPTSAEAAMTPGLGIAVDPGGSAYVTGVTDSADFPTSAGAFDSRPSAAASTPSSRS